MKFYLGAHQPHWLGKVRVPLFVSHRRLKDRRSFPRATCEWALDSGGFTELLMFGSWRTSVDAYVSSVSRYAEEVGEMTFASPMDWMCEPQIVDSTGLSVREHQERTVQNYLDLRGRGPFIPVLQGWTLPDYLACVGLYRDAGVDLSLEPIVGLGTVCRRQDTSTAEALVVELAGLGIALHGFGMKTTGLSKYGYLLHSADSMAWSFRGRHVSGCRSGHKTEANCPEFALAWRERVLGGLEYQQGHLMQFPHRGKEGAGHVLAPSPNRIGGSRPTEDRG